MGFTSERTRLKTRNHKPYDARQWRESTSSQASIQPSFRPAKNLVDDAIRKYNLKKKHGEWWSQLVAELGQ